MVNDPTLCDRFLKGTKAFSEEGHSASFGAGELRPLIPEELPASNGTLRGLYSISPYDPDKIPVIMTHGFLAPPAMWTKLCSSLCKSPQIEKSYQFWFYFFSTDEPFWISAAQLRKDLARLRETVVARGGAKTFDRMVLIGFSVGGLIARMQVQTSGNKLWELISSTAIDEIGFEPELLEDARSWFFFEPNPSIARVVTLGTPFRGSDFAKKMTRWKSSQTATRLETLERLAKILTEEQMSKLSDLNLLATSLATEASKSLETLSPTNPIFGALETLEIPKNVALNNIVGVVPSLERRKVKPLRSDGVNLFASASRSDVESELVVPAKHTEIQARPETIAFIRDILSRHLNG